MTLTSSFAMCTSQPLLADGAPFPPGGYAEQDLAVDPLLEEAIDSSSSRSRPMPSTTAATTTALAESQCFVDHGMWNIALEDHMSKQMPYLNTYDGFGVMDLMDNRMPDVANSSTLTTGPSSPRKRSETSSRSSIPSITNSSSSTKDSQKTQKNRKPKESTRQRRQSSTRKPATPQVKLQEFDEEDEEKRHRFLERNRVAASKCRAKKKEWVSELEETRHGLESQNNKLHLQYNSLVSELSQIKTELMAHASCHDSRIDQWIENEARRFVMDTARKYDAMPARRPSAHDVESLQRGSMRMQPSPAASVEAQLLSPQSANSSLNNECYSGPNDTFDN